MSVKEFKSYLGGKGNYNALPIGISIPQGNSELSSLNDFVHIPHIVVVAGDLTKIPHEKAGLTQFGVLSHGVRNSAYFVKELQDVNVEVTSGMTSYNGKDVIGFLVDVKTEDKEKNGPAIDYYFEEGVIYTGPNMTPTVSKYFSIRPNAAGEIKFVVLNMGFTIEAMSNQNGRQISTSDDFLTLNDMNMSTQYFDFKNKYIGGVVVIPSSATSHEILSTKILEPVLRGGFKENELFTSILSLIKRRKA